MKFHEQGIKVVRLLNEYEIESWHERQFQLEQPPCYIFRIRKGTSGLYKHINVSLFISVPI